MKECKMKFKLTHKIVVIVTLAFCIFTATMTIPMYRKPVFATDGPDIGANTILSHDAKFSLTKEEKEYIRKRETVKAAAPGGAAPIQYENANGEVRGISVSVLERISEMTGLNFEYRLYGSRAEAIATGADIFLGISYNYAPQGMKFSIPFLKSETILFINSSLQHQDIENLRYAAMKGSALPEGVNDKKIAYFNTREETLDAVNNGKADYGFGNAYSVAYYTLMHSYQNIVTVPKGKESRAYCFGMISNDQMLLSIINKAIASISPEELQTLILSVASDIERDLTPSMVMHEYGIQISLMLAFLIALLLHNLFSKIRANKMLSLQNRRYEILSGISNEFLYEYDVKSDILQLSERSKQIFDHNEKLSQITKKLIGLLSDNDNDNSGGIITLRMEDGDIAAFKTVSTTLYDDQGKRVSVIGKLIDVTEEAAEKEDLLAKARLDGLTDIYNAATTKKLIVERITNRQNTETDVFLLIDVDNFKEVNDTYGHLVGDEILKNVAERLKISFRKSDIVGRIGGDEFCVYVKNISDPAFIIEKCEQLINHVLKEREEFMISVSIGITMVQNKETYDDLFKRADSALYEAKEKGKAQFIFFS
ncbi:MAG: GGDEF domain-containing protein [Synergistota bacterium]|nr:GGDEF domain-containing protein [Synergistota bacterium]